MSTKKNSMSDNVKSQGMAIQDSFNKISAAAKRDPVLRSCSHEMMKPRSGLIFGANEAPKALPTPYVRCYKTVKWL